MGFKLADTKRGIKIAAKLLFVGAVIYYLGKEGFLSLRAMRQAFESPWLLLEGYCFYVIACWIASLRWYYLMRGLQIPISLGRTLYFGMLGGFFNTALPGAVSGDLVKAIYVGRDFPGRTSTALASIVFDRIIGTSTLILVSVGALLISLGTPWGLRLAPAIENVVLIAGLCVALFFAYLFWVPGHRDPLLRFSRWIESKFKWFESVTRTYDSVRCYGQRRSLVIASVVLSLGVHGLVVLSVFALVSALGGEHLPLLALAAVVPLGILVTVVPITPAGLGTGHAAFLWLFLSIGFDRGADVFTLYLLFRIISAIIGAILYLRFKSAQPSPFATTQGSAI